MQRAEAEEKISPCERRPPTGHGYTQRRRAFRPDAYTQLRFLLLLFFVVRSEGHDRVDDAFV